MVVPSGIVEVDALAAVRAEPSVFPGGPSLVLWPPMAGSELHHFGSVGRAHRGQLRGDSDEAVAQHVRIILGGQGAEAAAGLTGQGQS